MESIWKGGLTRETRWRVTLIAAIGFLAIIGPAITLTKGLPSIRPEEILLFGVFGINFVICIWRRLKDKDYFIIEREEWNPLLRDIHRGFLLLVLVVIVSDIWGVLALGVRLSFRDLMEFVTFFKYYLILTLVGNIEWDKRVFRMVLYGLSAGVLLDLLFTYLQSYNFADINNRFVPLIAPEVSVSNLLGYPVRTIGTLSNPNFNAMLLVMGLVLIVCSFYFQRLPRLTQGALIILFALMMKGMMMNISRMAILATALAFSYVSIRFWLNIGWKKELFIKIGIIFACTVLIWYTAPRSFTARMHEATNFNTSTSIMGHFNRWSLAIDNIKVSPVLGWGSAKGEMSTLVDNEYLLVMRRYGIPGIILYSGLFFTAFKRAHDLSRQGTINYFGVALEGITLGILLLNLNAGIFYQLQLMSVYCILTGLVYALCWKEGYS
ncbi:MAG: O-antigen ligase family protein [Desulfosporosinus sp.]